MSFASSSVAVAYVWRSLARRQLTASSSSSESCRYVLRTWLVHDRYRWLTEFLFVPAVFRERSKKWNADAFDASWLDHGAQIACEGRIRTLSYFTVHTHLSRWFAAAGGNDRRRANMFYSQFVAISHSGLTDTR